MAESQPVTRPLEARPSRDTREVPSLVALLGFKTVSDHTDELGLIYFIGCAYNGGARSLRQIAKRFRAAPVEDLAGRVGENLPKGLRAIHHAVGVVEDLLGVRSINQFLYLQGRSPSFWNLSNSWCEIAQEAWAPRPLSFFSAKIRPSRHHSRQVNSARPTIRANSSTEYHSLTC